MHACIDHRSTGGRRTEYGRGRDAAQLGRAAPSTVRQGYLFVTYTYIVIINKLIHRSSFYRTNFVPHHTKTMWPSGLRRRIKVPVRKSAGSNPAVVNMK